VQKIGVDSSRLLCISENVRHNAMGVIDETTYTYCENRFALKGVLNFVSELCPSTANQLEKEVIGRRRRKAHCARTSRIHLHESI
jgi:hypothetical protein